MYNFVKKDAKKKGDKKATAEPKVGDKVTIALGKGEGQSGVITTMEKGGFVVVKTDGGDFIAKSLVDVTAK